MTRRTFTLSTDFTCHGRWEQEAPREDPETADGRYRDTYKLSPTLSSLVDYNALASTGSGGAPGARDDSEGAGKRQVLVLSTGPNPREADNSLSRRYLCLSYQEREDGVLLARAGSCSAPEQGRDEQQDQQAARGVRDQQFYYQQQQQQQQQVPGVSRSRLLQFNITSSGPCLQALTGEGSRPAPASSTALTVAVVLLSAGAVLNFIPSL